MKIPPMVTQAKPVTGLTEGNLNLPENIVQQSTKQEALNFISTASMSEISGIFRTTTCPSGLRGSTRNRMASAAGVQISQSSLLLVIDSVRDGLLPHDSLMTSPCECLN